MWSDVPGFEGIQVTACGQIRCQKRGLMPGTKDEGYLKIRARASSGQMKTLWIHRAILLTFVGTPKPGEQANHINGNRSDNRVENLRWLTRSRTAHDSRIAERCKRLRVQGKTYREISRELGVSVGFAHHACRRNEWWKG